MQEKRNQIACIDSQKISKSRVSQDGDNEKEVIRKINTGVGLLG